MFEIFIFTALIKNTMNDVFVICFHWDAKSLFEWKRLFIIDIFIHNPHVRHNDLYSMYTRVSPDRPAEKQHSALNYTRKHDILTSYNSVTPYNKVSFINSNI